LIVNPVRGDFICQAGNLEDFGGYFDFMCKLVPSNVVQPFAENNVIGMMLIALGLSFATLTLPEENKLVLNSFFSSFFAALLRITHALVLVIPVGASDVQIMTTVTKTGEKDSIKREHGSFRFVPLLEDKAAD